jgi:hypothetical protein
MSRSGCVQRHGATAEIARNWMATGNSIHLGRACHQGPLLRNRCARQRVEECCRAQGRRGRGVQSLKTVVDFSMRPSPNLTDRLVSRSSISTGSCPGFAARSLGPWRRLHAVSEASNNDSRQSCRCTSQVQRSPTLMGDSDHAGTCDIACSVNAVMVRLGLTPRLALRTDPSHTIMFL